jgi:tetratricopeptide (TPR) repeat protein
VAITQSALAMDSMIDHYMEMRRYEKVKDLIGQALADQPEEARYYYLLAVCAYNLDDYEEVDHHLKQAMAFGFHSQKVHQLYGHLYTETGQWVKAEQAYLEALRENPNDAPVHAAYAFLLKKTGHSDKADKLMQMAMQLDPNDSEVIRCRHLFGIASQNRKEQIHALELYMQVADNEITKEIQLGLNALFRNRTKAAREHFRQAFLMDPTNMRLAEIMNDLDQVQHILMAPIRWINRIGGAAVFWIVGIGSISVTRALGWLQVSIVLLIIYISWVIYSWLATPLLKLINRIRG